MEKVILPSTRIPKRLHNAGNFRRSTGAANRNLYGNINSSINMRASKPLPNKDFMNTRP